MGLMDDDIMEKLQTATEDEQDKILKQFNIVRVEPPKRKVVEIDLFDSDDDDLDVNYDDGSEYRQTIRRDTRGWGALQRTDGARRQRGTSPPRGCAPTASSAARRPAGCASAGRPPARFGAPAPVSSSPPWGVRGARGACGG